MQYYRLGAGWIESSLTEKFLKGLTDKLNVSGQRTLAARQASARRDALAEAYSAGPGKQSFSGGSWETTSPVLCPVLGSPVQDTGRRSGSSKGRQAGEGNGAHGVQGDAGRGSRSFQPSEERARGRPHCSLHIPWRRAQRRWSRSSWRYMVTGLEAMDTSWRVGDSPVGTWGFFAMRVGKHWKLLPRGTVGSPQAHQDIQNATGHVPGQLSPTGPPLSRGQPEDLQWSFPANTVLLPVSTACSDGIFSCF